MAALADLRAHGAGLLVAAKRDRIARDVVVAATVEQLAKDAGARVVTADGVTVEDTPEGRLMRTLMDAFAEYERALIRARTKAALAVKRTRQERVSGRAPLGFRFEENKLVPDASEGALLARVRNLRSKGLSLARIASVLNAEGTQLRGGRLHVTTLPEPSGGRPSGSPYRRKGQGSAVGGAPFYGAARARGGHPCGPLEARWRSGPPVFPSRP